jgi:hypothetical protein
MTLSRVLVLVTGLAVFSPAIALAQTKIDIQKMDRDSDGVVTRAEWQGSYAAFNQHDTNDDNVLSGNEVWDGGYRRNNRNRPMDTTGIFNDWTPQAFTNIDRNRDGRLTLSEWQWDRESFDRADRNGDHVLTRAEFLGEEKGPPGEGSWSPAYRAGYERGQIEGRVAGREDRDRNQGYDLDGQRELETADSGYEARVGSRTEYQDGYRHGFRAAYPEGWNRR